MIIRTKAGIDALPEGRIRELAETTLKVLNLQNFIEMEVDDVYNDISEGMFIRTKGEEISILYPGVENGKLEYGYLERKQKTDGIKTSSYVIREESLVIKQHIGGFRTKT